MTQCTQLVGDCREVMRSIADASVDLVLTDPPYGDTACDWDTRVDGWLAEVRRVLKPSGSLWCFGSMRFFLERGGDFSAWTYAQEIVWEKHNGSNAFADRFRRVHELAVHYYPNDVRWGDVYHQPVYSNDAQAKTVRRKQKAQHWSKIEGSSYASMDGGPRLLRSVIFCRSEHGRAVHPTQKPVALLIPLIEYSCPPGGVVLDPFSGSGSTGLACEATGRNSILIEARPDYAAAATERIHNDAPLFKA